MTASPAAIMPRSPWLASPGWTNCAGVPVEARVAAILRATWPLFPMPVTMTRPRMPAISATAASKRSSRPSSKARSPSISMRRTRRAARMPALSRFLGWHGGVFRHGIRRVGEGLRRPGPRGSTARYRGCETRQSPTLAAHYADAGLNVNQRGRAVAEGATIGRSSMREDVDFRPTFEVEEGARGQETEAGLRELGPLLARQHLVEPAAQRVQVEDVRGRVAP